MVVLQCLYIIRALLTTINCAWHHLELLTEVRHSSISHSVSGHPVTNAQCYSNPRSLLSHTHIVTPQFSITFGCCLRSLAFWSYASLL